MQGVRMFLAQRFILLLVSLALLAVTLITVTSMSAAVLVAETVQGSGSAINVAGSLRRLTHRITSLIVADGHTPEQPPSPRIGMAIADFEHKLADPQLRAVLDKLHAQEPHALYQDIQRKWTQELRPRLSTFTLPPAGTPAEYAVLLDEADRFVDQLNAFVDALERDTEERISNLRHTLGAAILLIAVVMILALVLLQRRFAQPLQDLLKQTDRFARGEFSARVAHTGQDELGQLGKAFNTMATDLTKLYRELEDHVHAKTQQLQRSNESLSLLYHAIARLYHAPTDPSTYSDTAQHMDAVLGLPGTFACLLPKHDGPATVLAASHNDCPARLEGRCAGGGCVLHPDEEPMYSVKLQEGEQKVMLLPLRDVDGHYGMLRLELPHTTELAEWQRQLIEALSRHMGMAMGTARRAEHARLLALQEERSVIARELHDSLAQALSYMKIQVSLLQRSQEDPARVRESAEILADLRIGLNAAYRQLRELLASFRLSMSGDFRDLIQDSVINFGARGNVPIQLDICLAGCHLTPNEEIHVLHIVREALSNIVRHAQAQQAWVTLAGEECQAGESTCHVTIDDDGIGLEAHGQNLAGPYHHGLTIMRERARNLGGSLEIGPRPGGGTRISLSFPVASATVAT